MLYYQKRARSYHNGVKTLEYHEALCRASGHFYFASELNGTDAGYDSGTDTGFVVPHIGYITDGHGVMISKDRTLDLNPGDLVYIPAAYPYRSEWDAVRFYTFVVGTSLFDDTAFTFQRIHAPDLLPRFDALNETARRGDTRAYSAAAFALYAEIVPLLERSFAVFPPELLPASRYIEAHFNENFPVAALAKLCSMSEPRFYARFKESVGMSPVDCRNAMRVRHAILALREGGSSEEVASSCGFCSVAFMRRMMLKFAHITPKAAKSERMWL